MFKKNFFKDFSPLLQYFSSPALPSPTHSIFMKDIWELYSLQPLTLFTVGLAIQSLIITKIIIIDISVLTLLKENAPSEGLKQLAHVVQEGFLYPVAIKSGRISEYI